MYLFADNARKHGWILSYINTCFIVFFFSRLERWCLLLIERVNIPSCRAVIPSTVTTETWIVSVDMATAYGQCSWCITKPKSTSIARFFFVVGGQNQLDLNHSIVIAIVAYQSLYCIHVFFWIVIVICTIGTYCLPSYLVWALFLATLLMISLNAPSFIMGIAAI